MLVRVSAGSLAVLGIRRLAIVEGAQPRTLYILQYSPDGCLGGCRFCSQSRVNGGGLFLSRITWPAVELDAVLEKIRSMDGVFERICVQSILKERFFEELAEIVGRVVETGLPVSVAVTPIHPSMLRQLEMLGAERLGVGLDAASPRVFAAVGKPYTWRVYMKFIGEAVNVFGEGMVHVHLIAGLGETPRELAETMTRLYSMGARVALFRYTKPPGAKDQFPGVDIYTYRAHQIARLLLEKGYNPLDHIDYTSQPPRVRWLPLAGREILEALLTSGCPGCNRPFYNESPRGPIYNYPSMKLLISRLNTVRKQLRAIGVDIED